MNRAADYLRHMLEAARQACAYVEGLSKPEFLDDKRTQQAVILNLVIIGEAATKLMNDHPETVDQWPSVPWRSMRGMRNRLTHGYFDIDLDIVWDTVAMALPGLVSELASKLPPPAEGA